MPCMYFSLESPEMHTNTLPIMPLKRYIYGFDNHFRIFSPQMLYAPHVLQVRKFMKGLEMHGCFPSEKFDFWSPRYS